MIRVLCSGTNQLTVTVWMSAVDDTPGMAATAEATDLRDVLRRMHTTDVIVFDPGALLEEGVGWVRAIRAEDPNAKVLVVGIPHEDFVVLAYVEAGASGYVLQDESVDAALQAVREVMGGEARVSADLAPALIHRLFALKQACVDPQEAGLRIEALTPREREVLELLASGLTNKEIAGLLTIGMGTVKNHVHNILGKLDTPGRLEAATFHRANEAQRTPDR